MEFNDMKGKGEGKSKKYNEPNELYHNKNRDLHEKLHKVETNEAIHQNVT